MYLLIMTFLSSLLEFFMLGLSESVRFAFIAFGGPSVWWLFNSKISIYFCLKFLLYV